MIYSSFCAYFCALQASEIGVSLGALVREIFTFDRFDEFSPKGKKVKMPTLPA